MEIYETALWGVAGWTLMEGCLVTLFPSQALRLARRWLPGVARAMEGMDPPHLRKLGAVELCFGLLLGAYLLAAT